MPYQYVHRTRLKAVAGVTSTAHDSILDFLAGEVSKSITQYAGHVFQPRTQQRFYTARAAGSLYLPDDLLSVSELAVDTSGGYAYGTVISSGGYLLGPYNATAEDPPRPYYELDIRSSATATLPTHARGVRITGSYGYYDVREDVAATIATAVAASTTSLPLNTATAVHPGQTLLIGAEQVLVKEITAASNALVERAAHGTSATSYSSGQAIQAYTYPVVAEACLFQVLQDFRVKDAPGGVEGVGEFSQPYREEFVRGGLHPFVRRSLDQFRTPVIA